VFVRFWVFEAIHRTVGGHDSCGKISCLLFQRLNHTLFEGGVVAELVAEVSPETMVAKGKLITSVLDFCCSI